MANGFCPALLRTIDAVNRENSPTRKLHNAGFLSMLNCCANDSVNPIHDGTDDFGHTRALTVSYRERPLVSQVSDEDTCDNDIVPQKKEWTLPGYNYASLSQYISDATVRAFCEEASRERSIGTPATRVMNEVYDLFLQSANTVMKKVNQDLVTDMLTQFGDNVTTGSSAGKSINFDRGAGGLILDNGMIEVMRDILENEICGTPCMVGGGIWTGYEMAKLIACCNQAGLDISRLNMPKIFFDKDTQNIWGENSLGVFAPGSLAFLEYMQYKRSFSGGPKGAGSYFFTAPLPVNEFGCADDCQAIEFDVQLKYYDCPTEITSGGGTITVPRGWQIIVSKTYALWVQPTTGFQAGDELEGTNGTLKYFATNHADTGAGYAYP